jgi:hypothetical protein
MWDDKTTRQRGKSPTLTVLYDVCYEGCPTLNFDKRDGITVNR